MPTRRPPRREPRVLAVDRNGERLMFAVADPWDVRSAGVARVRPRSLASALLRIVRREKPTTIVVARSLEGAARRVASIAGLSVIPAPRRLADAVAEDLYPDLALVAPTALLRRTARAAIAAVLYSDVPRRSYAKSSRTR